MGLFRRTDSPYWWMWLRAPDGGKPKKESTGIPFDAPTAALRQKNRTAADEHFCQRELAFIQAARGRAPAPEKPTITFKEYASWYELHVCKAHGSYLRERSVLHQLADYFGVTPLQDIDRSAVIEWRTWRIDGDKKAHRNSVSPATADRDLDVLKSLFMSAVPKYIDTSPIAGLKRHRDTKQAMKRRPRVLTVDEETRLLEAATDRGERALILLALDTLMRLSDVKELRRDRDYGDTIHVEAPKVMPYDVPVSTRLRKALDELPANGQYFFPRRWAGKEAGLSSNTVWRIFRRLCKSANIPVGRKIRGVTFHSLRHTGTTRMLEAGVNPVAVKEIGGWLSMRQLDRYGHSTEETKRRAVNLIGRESDGSVNRPSGDDK